MVCSIHHEGTYYRCSKAFQLEMDGQSQSPLVQQAQAYIESNVNEKISVKQLASKFVVSRRQFDRRFIEATVNTPFEYIQRAKVEAAKKNRSW